MRVSFCFYGAFPPLWCNYKDETTLKLMQILFEWNDAKNRANRRKHGLSFEEAALVFRDPGHVSTQDQVKDGEERWQTIGLVKGVLLLMVAHTVYEESAQETSVRIISARRATQQARRFYEDENSSLYL